MPDEFLPTLAETKGDLLILAEIIGVRKALMVSERFDGSPVKIYGHRRFLRQWRDHRIREEYDRGGISVIDLARKHKLSDRHLYTILGKVSEPRNGNE